jgi:hypothetical protein
MIDTLLHEKIAARLSHVAPAIPVGISNRHVHLAQQDVEALFGKGYVLTPFKPLRQPGQFAAQECVTVVGPKGSLPGSRPRPNPPGIAAGNLPRRLLYPRHQSAGSRIRPAGERGQRAADRPGRPR